MKCNSTEEELAQLFDEERRIWMQNDEEGWVDSSCMYPGVAEALRGKDNFYVLTSCDLDSMNAARVLRRNGVKLPDERIIECRGDKASALVAVAENIRRRAHLRFGPPPGSFPSQNKNKGRSDVFGHAHCYGPPPGSLPAPCFCSGRRTHVLFLIKCFTAKGTAER